MLTREADYAIRAVLGVAQAEGTENRTSVRELSEEFDVPYRFLRRIVTELVNAGILNSKRGNRGGLGLAREAAQINLLDVVTAIDTSSFKLNTCLLEDHACERSTRCRVHTELSRIQSSLNDQLRDLTFDALLCADDVTSA